MDKNQLALLKKSFDVAVLKDAQLSMTRITKPILGSETKAEQFSNEVIEVVKSDEFITKLDQKIGDVLPGETEDEFVARAKKTMLNALRSKFD
ncbi:hypothetical protein PRCB_02250 [Pantoea rodasii]|uniref:Uncharacterized protein n=1 Tax=Pantoea rodasii TaxID=1076549 RepID=A0A2M9WIX9_9GAMM|nr:hypothetical protein [Pantoea rodasii]ORM64351.1 hypothetical protein HA45_11120 [Pantoea rodasii]PJZ07501.1 hypothetical protein PRCB_02250 [Pantoea rodasii]